jgi:Phosphatidylinositol-specific phospholipase C, X domain
MLILWFQFRQRQVISKLPSNIQEAQIMKREWDLMAMNGSVAPLPSRHPGHGFREGFGLFTTQETDMANELANVSVALGGAGSISSYNVKTLGNLPIKEFLIKASYNSACTGQYMNADMIKYVLSRGCRLLDFQLYYNTDSNSVMVSSFMPDNVTKTVQKDLSLGDALNAISQYGFSAPSPNSGDPLFIQFRFNKSNAYGVSNYVDTMIKDVAALLESRLSNKFYNGKVDVATTKIGDLMGKYVIISDTVLKDRDGVDLVNIPLGKGKFPLFTSKDIMNYTSAGLVIDSNDKSSNTTMMKFVCPLASDTKNMQGPLIMNTYSAQIVEMMYYVTDNRLNEYETMFYSLGNGLVPLNVAKDYISNLH